MKLKFRYIFLALSLAAGTTTAFAATVDDARRLMEDGDPAGAEAALRELIAAEPKNSEADIMLGDCLWQLGRDSEALDAYAEGRR